MSIRDISLSTQHSDHLQKKQVSESQNRPSAVDQDRGKSATEPRDRVDISDAARAAHGGKLEMSADLELARAALRHTPAASEERLAQIQARLEAGYYTSDRVAAQMAGAIVAAIKGGDSV